MQNPDVLPLSEAVSAYGRSRTTLLRWTREGRLTKFVDRSRHVYLSRVELDRETAPTITQAAS